MPSSELQRLWILKLTYYLTFLRRPWKQLYQYFLLLHWKLEEKRREKYIFEVLSIGQLKFYFFRKMRSVCKIFFAFSYIFASLMIIILNQYCIKYASKFHGLLYWSKLLIFNNAVKKAKHISGFARSFVEIFIFAHVTQWLSCGIFWNSIRFHRLEYFFVFCFFSVWLPLNWNFHLNLLLVRSFHNHFI